MGPSGSVLSNQTSSGFPVSEVEVFPITDYLVLLTGAAGD